MTLAYIIDECQSSGISFKIHSLSIGSLLCITISKHQKALVQKKIPSITSVLWHNIRTFHRKLKIPWKRYVIRLAEKYTIFLSWEFHFNLLLKYQILSLLLFTLIVSLDINGTRIEWIPILCIKNQQCIAWYISLHATQAEVGLQTRKAEPLQYCSCTNHLSFTVIQCLLCWTLCVIPLTNDVSESHITIYMNTESSKYK